MPADINWQNTESRTRRFVCPHCGVTTASLSAYVSKNSASTQLDHRILICPECRLPTYFGPDGVQIPGVAFGRAVEHLQPPVEAAYNEARRCMSVAAYTAAVMLCRKILMNVAVHEGADKNEGFKYYVEYLANEHHLPKRLDGCVAHIREIGNEANHEIEATDKETAERVMNFTEIMLTVMYEMPGRLPEAEPQPEGTDA